MAGEDECGIRVEHLSFGYRAEEVLHDVSFCVGRGQFAALLGPNGAGKSSIFALLTRMVTTRQGRITVAGADLRRQPRLALARMGVVFQERTLDPDLTVRQNLAYYAALRGLSGPAARQAIEAAMERLGIAARAGDKARLLNGGHRRRTEIARALLHRPEVLLLDEPTVGLDPASRAAITDHVHALCAEDGLTVLWATHLVDEVRPGDRIVLLDRGRVLAQDSAAALAGAGTLEQAFLALTGGRAPAEDALGGAPV